MKWYVYENEKEIFLTPGKLVDSALTFLGYIGEYDSYSEANENLLKYGYVYLIEHNK